MQARRECNARNDQCPEAIGKTIWDFIVQMPHEEELSEIPLKIPGSNLVNGSLAYREAINASERGELRLGHLLTVLEIFDDFLNEDFLQNHLPVILATLNSDEKLRVLTSLAIRLEEGSKQKCATNHSDLRCAAFRQGVEAVSGILLSHLSPLAKNQERQGQLELYCDVMPLSAASSLSEVFSNFRESVNCLDLIAGAPGVETIKGGPNPVRYRISKPNDQSYLLEIPLHFLAEDVSPTELSDFVKTVEECLVSLDGHLFAPEGESIKIRTIASETKFSQEIFVTRRAVRENSALYSLQSDCQTITHEVFHALGLVDLYKEKLRGYKIDPRTGYEERVADLTQEGGRPAYDCRHLGPDDSIMSHHELAFTKTFGGTNLYVCACPSNMGAVDCSEKLAAIPLGQARCPEDFGVGVYSTSDVLPRGTDLNAYVRSIWGVSPNIPNFRVITTTKILPARQNLLYPGEAQAILFPNCNSRRSAYDFCSRSAYTTSNGSGQGCDPNPPQACRDQSWVTSIAPLPEGAP